MRTFIISILFLTSPCFATETFGIFMVVKGSVNIKSKNGTVKPAKVSSKVIPGDTLISGPDSRGKVVMSDRNVINVSSDTTLVIKDYRNDPASGVKNVELELIAGKVRNNVEQTYDGDKNKFQVKTPTAVAGVRGTQFFTSFNPTTQMTSIVTLKGSVTLATVNPNGKIIGAPVVIQRGETATSSPGAPPPAPTAVPKDDLKKIDLDSSASTSSKSDSSPSDKKEPTSNGSKGPGDQSPDGSSKTDSPSKTDSSGKADPSNKSDSPNKTDSPTKKDNSASREVASERPKNSQQAPSMIDKGDISSDMARDIKNPVPPSTPITSVPDRINAPTTPRNPINPNVSDIIRNNNQKTNLIVIPKTK